MQNKIKFALIGCGAISKKHTESLKRIPEAEIVAVCDANPEIASSVGKTNNVPSYTSYHEMAEKEDIEGNDRGSNLYT